MSAERTDTTLAALLTPSGTGAISVVRLSGPRALEILRRRFAPASGVLPDALPLERLHYGHWLDTPAQSPISQYYSGAQNLPDRRSGAADCGFEHYSPEVIDDVIVAVEVCADGGAVVDISTHGGVRVVERMLLSLQQDGARVVDWNAAPSSFSHPRDAIEAEALAMLVQAHTPRAVRFLAYQRQHLSTHITDIARCARQDSDTARRMLGKLAARALAWRYLVEGATIVLTGPVNAGKSTLANRLLGTEHSIVSPLPGTTRDWVAEGTAIHGIPVTIVDTAGLRETGDDLESEGIRRARAQSRAADLRLLVLDRSDPRGAAVMQGVLPAERRSEGGCGDQTILVLNKVDLLSGWDLKPYDWDGPVALVSAATGDGLGALHELIVARLGLADPDDAVPGLFTQRQRDTAASLLAAGESSGQALGERIIDELLIAGPRRADKSAIPPWRAGSIGGSAAAGPMCIDVDWSSV